MAYSYFETACCGAAGLSPISPVDLGAILRRGGVGDQYMLKQRFSYNRAGVTE